MGVKGLQILCRGLRKFRELSGKIRVLDSFGLWGQGFRFKSRLPCTEEAGWEFRGLGLRDKDRNATSSSASPVVEPGIEPLSYNLYYRTLLLEHSV